MQGKLSPRPRLTQRLRWLLRGTAAALVVLATLWALRQYQPGPPSVTHERWQQVRLSPLETPPETQVGSMAIRQQHEATTLRLQRQKALDPAATRATLEKQALLHALEDLELRLALHRDDPAFEAAPWLARRAKIQQQLRELPAPANP
jgi:hypothetical protein